jgi:hypothetical protein
MWFNFPFIGRAVGAYFLAPTTSGVARGWYELGLWPTTQTGTVQYFVAIIL